jgi:hypothetical protein
MHDLEARERMKLVDDLEFLEYSGQILKFLNSITIKYIPMIDYINDAVTSKGYSVDLNKPDTWKYYVNLTGNYHESDTPMFVRSVDTKEIIAFTKENLNVHTLTRKTYVTNTSLYDELCSEYPKQTDLIKSILYPVLDINLAISSDNLSLLCWGDDILEENERASVLSDLTSLLTYIKHRWYFDFFYYETYYFVTFWGQLWSILYMSILLTRIKNLNTPSVHSFHIWSYLSSHGIASYKDVLTKRSSLYLYRNMKYLRANRGSSGNLIRLVDNLLRENGIGLVQKVIYQTVDPLTAPTTCTWVPTFASEVVPTEFSGVLRSKPNEDTASVLHRLYDEDAISDISYKSVSSVEAGLGRTRYNRLPTKFLEISPIAIDKKYADLFNNFVWSFLTHMIFSDKYSGTLSFSDNVTGITHTLTYKEAMIYLHYVSNKYLGIIPTSVPRYAEVSIYRDNPLEHIKRDYDVLGHKRRTSSYIDIVSFVRGIEYPIGVLSDSDDFVKYLLDQFNAFIYQFNAYRSTADVICTEVISKVHTDIVDRKIIELYDSDTQYTNWFVSTRESLQSIQNAYDKQDKPYELYGFLFDDIITQLVPITEGIRKLINETTTDPLFGKLKDLFVNMCSYNVFFMNTQRDAYHWAFVSKHILNVTSELEDKDDWHMLLDVLVMPSGTEETQVRSGASHLTTSYSITGEQHQIHLKHVAATFDGKVVLPDLDKAISNIGLEECVVSISMGIPKIGVVIPQITP